MLEFLGAKAASTQKRDRVIALEAAVKANSARAQAAYDVIVLGKLPEASESTVQASEAMKSHFYGVMTKLLSGEQADAMRDAVTMHVERMASKLEKDLEKAAVEALRAAAGNYRPVVIKKGRESTLVKGVLPKEFETIVQLCSMRVPVMLVGPAGCGKTFIAGKVAEGLGLEFSGQSCSEGISESIFTGWLLPIGKSGTFTYVRSPFVKAYEEGGVFLLDEMDASDPNLLTFLNQAIANEFFFLPQRHENPKVVKHENFVVIGAANTFGHGANTEYVGRNALDAATLDRFRAGMVYMDYSDEVENALVNSDVRAWGLRVRACIKRHQLRRIMSTRVMLDLTRMTHSFSWGTEQWERAYFADWSHEELSKWRTP